MQPDLWKITCEEHLYPGLWQRWFRSQSVALGWPPKAGFHLDGSGVSTLGWTIARNALKRIKSGDQIFVTLQGSRVARLGTVTELLVHDSEWDPFIPPSRTENMARRAGVTCRKMAPCRRKLALTIRANPSQDTNSHSQIKLRG